MRSVVLVVALLAACDGADGPTALHDVDKQLDFFALPFPNDRRLASDGTIDLTGFPSGLSTEVDRYVAAFDHRLTGWGTQAAIYFRFDAPIAPSSLPSLEGSREASSSVQLVDITPTSPTFGVRQPVSVVFHPIKGDYIGANWLSVRPMTGAPLRGQTTYAALVLTDVRGTNGARVRAPSGFSSTLQTTPQYAPLATWLAANQELAGRLANATVFTTQDATGPMRRLREATFAKAPAPMVKNLVFLKTTALYDVYAGQYEAPNFQEGDVPYYTSGGRIVDDTDGLPKVQRTETMRFAMSIPKAAMPTGGWPLVVYAHGTGGNYLDFVDDKSADGVAHVVEASGATLADMAMISIDMPLHGARDPSGEGPSLTFNLGNVDSLFDNLKQGAADDYSLLRAIPTIEAAAADSPMLGLSIKFDLARLYFKGHSQGGITGALFLPFAPEIKAAILSGTGGTTILSLIAKEMYASVLQLLIDGPIDETHPVLNLFQTFAESSDPANFARGLFREPEATQPGQSKGVGKSIFVSFGLGDTDTPNVTTWSFVQAMGAQPISPIVLDSPTLALSDLAWGVAPIANNVANDTATGVMLQYTPPAGRDGHFVIFSVAAARDQSNRFLATHAKTSIATLTAP